MDQPRMEVWQEDDVDLGPCCVCEKAGPDVRNVVMLDRKGPVPGRGWGCLVCDLPLDGAVAVLCDDCLANRAGEIRFVCNGCPKDGRLPIEELAFEPFEHRMACH